MSSVIFATRSNFRGELAKAREAHAEDNKIAAGQIQRLQGENVGLKGDLARKESELKSEKVQSGTLTAELEKARRDAIEYQSRLAAEQDSVKKLAGVTESLSGDNKRLVADNDKLRVENRDTLAKLSAEQTRANELASANSQLKEQLEQNRTQLADARDAIKLHDEIFAKLSEKGHDVRSIIHNYNTYPPVKARVVTYDPMANMVVLNVGAKQEVRKNFQFTIFRGDTFVATCDVFDVQDELCAARIVAKKTNIERGDNAWTRLE